MSSRLFAKLGRGQKHDPGRKVLRENEVRENGTGDHGDHVKSNRKTKCRKRVDTEDVTAEDAAVPSSLPWPDKSPG